VVNLVLNLVLVRVMGFRGLALGTAIAAVINAGALLWLLRQRLGGIEGGRVAVAFLKISIASTVMGAAAWYTAHWLAAALPGPAEVLKLVRVGLAIGAGLLTLVVSAKLLRIAEFDEAFGRVMRRLLPSR
jgi:putative peptidoglycan lipid II flippase